MKSMSLFRRRICSLHLSSQNSKYLSNFSFSGDLPGPPQSIPTIQRMDIMVSLCLINAVLEHCAYLWLTREIPDICCTAAAQVINTGHKGFRHCDGMIMIANDKASPMAVLRWETWESYSNFVSESLPPLLKQGGC